MGGILDRLEAESLEVTRRMESGRITLGFDYVVVAEKKEEGESTMNGVHDESSEPVV
jgi:hypothetical protein